MSDVLDLPFDQYQRYQLVSRLVEELRGKNERLTILDVGGRTALLRRFLERDRITLVDLEASEESGLVLGDGSALPFADASFDLVCAFDTLEHVPPALRAKFVRECARVAKRWVVLAGPYQSEEVEEAEKLLQKFLKDKLGVRHRYLEEHRHHGLPDQHKTEQQLEELGARVVSLGHGNVQRWLSLISMAMYMDHTPELQAQAVRLHRFYNRGLFDADEEPPVYRHAVVAALHGARLPRERKPRAKARPPAGELLHFAQELAAFDAHRDGYQAELGRLRGAIRELTADLAGHKQSLREALERRAEAQRAQVALAADLEGHKRSLAELRERRGEAEDAIATLHEDLESHRRSLAEVAARRSEAEQVIATLQKDIDGHRASLAELRQLRKESELVIATLQSDLASHHGSLQELSAGIRRYEDLLAEHRAVIVDREGELERHGRVLQELRTNLAALDAEQAKVKDLRESERREFEAVRGELQHEIGALQTVRGALESELHARAAHTTELENLLARENQNFADELQRVHAERASAQRVWEDERQAFEAMLAGRDAELGVQRGMLDELGRECTALRENSARLEALLQRERAAFEAEQQRLRSEREAAQRSWQGERAAFEGVIAAREAEVQRRTQVQQAAETELDAHKQVLRAREQELTAQRAVLETREQELVQHKRVLEARERELAEHRRVAADLAADLGGHRALVAELRGDLARRDELLRAQEAEIELRGQLLEQRARETAEAQAEGALRAGELAHARDQLADLRAALERARGEITAAAAALVERERRVESLRAELRSRLANLRRAFGPKRPAPGE